MTSNAYELACDRMETARRNCRKAKREAERIVREAEDEWTAADANLTRYETRAGIPLPEYRADDDSPYACGSGVRKGDQS